MKKIEYIESVKYSLKNVHQGIRYNNEYISVVLSGLYDDLIYRLYDKKDALDMYVKEYERTVQEDDGDYYVQLDVYPVQLKRQAGIYYVKTKGYNGVMGERLAYANSIEDDIYESLNVNRVDEKGTYYVQGNKVFLQMYGDLSDIKTVRIGVVRQFNDYSDEEEVYMPKQATEAIISQALQKLAAKPVYDDNINDNSDNITANATD